jgi:manganese transport protein
MFYPLLKKYVKDTPITTHGEIKLLKNFAVTTFKNIAITVDFGYMDNCAINAAIAQGGKDAHYVLIHVSESAGAIVLGHDTNDLESNEDMKNLKLYQTNLLENGFSVSTKLGFGNPKKIIPEIVNEIAPNLLVMGAHGHDTLKDLIFGTTLDVVRHQVKASILIVKE